jgi:hypothetical protein
MLVFLISNRMMGRIVLAVRAIVTPEAEVLEMLLGKETTTVTAMGTKGNSKGNFLSLHLGLKISHIPAKVVIACQRNVRSIFETTVFVAE